MADKPAPQTIDADAEEQRQLKDAVARLGASLREESERIKQEPLDDLPIPAAPRDRPDPRIDALDQRLATLLDLQQQAADQASREVELARAREAVARRLAVTALVVAAIAVVVAVVALIAAVAS
jgi:hypothetical protein